ncbi:clamp loader small subunit [Vibrio phage vB_VmeM-32]|nr:clamp loader small subunit [Vibrio phage vB_VmeM-32]
MSSLSCLFDDEPELNEHQIAWYSQDWQTVTKLANSFKEPKERSLFQIIDNVTTKSGGHKNVDEFSDYDQYMINQALSQHVVMVGYVSELNQMSNLTNQQHYDYLFHTIRKTSLPKTSFARVTDDWNQKMLIALYCEYYAISKKRALEWIEFDTKTGKINEIKKTLKLILDEQSPLLKILPNAKVRNEVLNSVKEW